MLGRTIKHGATDQSTVIRIVDSADGTPETGVEHNTSGIDLWYRREGATKVSITEAALAALDTAHSDGGIEHIGDGYYRLDLPDAACATGAAGVMVGGAVTDMVVIGTYHPLSAFILDDGATAAEVRAEIDSNSTQLAAILADTAEIGAAGAGLTALATQASVNTIDNNVDAILADTADMQPKLGAPAGASLAADVAAVKAQTAAIETDTQDLQSRTPAALVSGRMDASVGAIAANAITATSIASSAISAAKIATDAFTAVKFAADVTTEFQNGLATAASIAALENLSSTQAQAAAKAALVEMGAIENP